MINNIKNIPVGKIETKTIKSYNWHGSGNYVRYGIFADPQSYTFPWTIKYALLFGEFYYIDRDRDPGSLHDCISYISASAKTAVTKRVLNPYGGPYGGPTYETYYEVASTSNAIGISGKTVSIGYINCFSSESWNKSEAYSVHEDVYLIAVGE